MSLHNDLDIASDIANIVAFDQRAAMLANQAAQLNALQNIQHQNKIQALRLEHEKTLQDTLFSISKFLPSISAELQDNPRKALMDLFYTKPVIERLSPSKFSGLEWKELALNVQEELNSIITRLGDFHGAPMVQELNEMLEAEKRLKEERELSALLFQKTKWQSEQRIRNIQETLAGFNIALAIIFGVTLFGIASAHQWKAKQLSIILDGPPLQKLLLFWCLIFGRSLNTEN